MEANMASLGVESMGLRERDLSEIIYIITSSKPENRVVSVTLSS